MKVISEEWVQALLRYLISRPYNEVYQIVPVLQNLPDAPVEKVEPNDPPSA